MAKRIIELLTPIKSIAINTADWRGVADAKSFDDKQTQILRVTRHRADGTLMVYGMRSKQGKIEAEAYDIAQAGESVQDVITRVAKNCGCETLVDGVIAKLP